MAVHWIRFAECRDRWGLFRENGDGSIRVLVIIDAGDGVIWDYNNFPREDARKLWRTATRQLGFHPATPAELTAANMNPHTLNLRALPIKHRHGRGRFGKWSRN